MDDVYEQSNMAVEARRVEIEYFRKMMVYKKVPRSMARGHKVITTTWLDITKGDKDNPNYRSRLVGRELKLNDNRMDLLQRRHHWKHSD